MDHRIPDHPPFFPQYTLPSCANRRLAVNPPARRPAASAAERYRQGATQIHIKMKIFYQPPSTPEGKRFFSRYAALIPNLTVAGYLAQLVSALTEWGILYALLFTSIAPLWPEYAATASIGGATVGVAIIEIGLRRLLPFASRAVILKQVEGLRWRYFSRRPSRYPGAPGSIGHPIVHRLPVIGECRSYPPYPSQQYRIG